MKQRKAVGIRGRGGLAASEERRKVGQYRRTGQEFRSLEAGKDIRRGSAHSGRWDCGGRGVDRGGVPRVVAA